MWLLWTAATFLERWITPATTQLAPPLTLVRQVLSSRERITVSKTMRKDWGPRQLRSRILQLWRSDLHLAQSTRETRSRSPQRLEGREETFGLTDVHLFPPVWVFVMQHIWCWKCGGWSVGSRRASRLKDPCGVPTKTGADVVYRVSGGSSSQSSCVEIQMILLVKNPEQ